MQIDGGYVVILILFLGMSLWTYRLRKLFHVSAAKFSELVASQNKPIVIQTNAGWFNKRLVYQLPYHGIIFQTDIPSGYTLPSGTVVVRKSLNDNSSTKTKVNRA